MADKEYFEDCQIGDKTTTARRTLTETDVVMFAAFTGDWNPQHTDAEAAKQTEFGERIAHGLLTLVVGQGLLFRTGGGTLLPRSLLALAGIDRVRFVEPVKLGDTICLEAEIVELTRMQGDRGLIRYQFRVKNQHDTSVVTGRCQVLAGCRPHSQEPPADDSE